MGEAALGTQLKKCGLSQTGDFEEYMREFYSKNK